MKTSDLQTEVEKLQTEIVDLRLRFKTQKSGVGLASDEEVVKKSITRWEKFFGIFYFLGVTVNDFVAEKPDFKHDHPSRYEDSENNAHLGTVAELYAVIPANFMDYLVKFEVLAGQVSLREIPNPADNFLCTNVSVLILVCESNGKRSLFGNQTFSLTRRDNIS
jgi:hypothetical protein